MTENVNVIKVVFTDGEVLEILNADNFWYSQNDNTWKISKRAESISVNANFVKYIGRKKHIDNAE